MSQFGVETQTNFCSLRSQHCIVPYSQNCGTTDIINFVTDLQLAPAPTIPRTPLFEPNLRHWRQTDTFENIKFVRKVKKGLSLASASCSWC